MAKTKQTSWIHRLLLVALVFSGVCTHAVTPEQAQAARKEIAQIQSIFLQEAQSATGLPRTELLKFMPGGALYGREITEFHRLSPTQRESLRQADSRKKQAITRIREKYGISPEAARSKGSRF